MPKSIAIKFVEFEGGCMIPLSHSLNGDGYFRKGWHDGMEMFHRFIFRAVNNMESIPEGYEINHKCRNRACCNPDHLEVLERTEHLIKTNKERYKDRNDKARKDWQQLGLTARQLAEKYNVCYDTGLRWIREWSS